MIDYYFNITGNDNRKNYDEINRLFKEKHIRLFKTSFFGATDFSLDNFNCKEIKDKFLGGGISITHWNIYYKNKLYRKVKYFNQVIDILLLHWSKK